MEANKVFRQAVLDRLASPEQLHTLMQVTDAKGWFALVGSGVLIVTALVWGVFGHVPTKIEASGILMHAGGLADVVAIGAGQIVSVDVDVGDYVTKGQLVAKVAQPELNEQLNGLQSKLVELKANFESSKAAGNRDQSLRANEASKERQNLEASILQNEQRSHELEEKLVTQSGLYAKGLVTNESLQATRDALRSTQVAVDGMRANQQRLEVDSFSAERVNEAMLMGQTMQTQETERQISLLKEKLEQSDHDDSRGTRRRGARHGRRSRHAGVADRQHRTRRRKGFARGTPLRGLARGKNGATRHGSGARTEHRS